MKHGNADVKLELGLYIFISDACHLKMFVCTFAFDNRSNLVIYSQVLMYLGPDALKEAIESAELYPIRGLFNFRDYFDELDAYYHRTLGYDIGLSTGWNNLNGLYNVRAVYLISTSPYYHTSVVNCSWK